MTAGRDFEAEVLEILLEKTLVLRSVIHKVNLTGLCSFSQRAEICPVDRGGPVEVVITLIFACLKSSFILSQGAQGRAYVYDYGVVLPEAFLFEVYR